jgi:hypothetical protein
VTEIYTSVIPDLAKKYIDRAEMAATGQMWIAEQCRVAPLPMGWVEYINAEDGRSYFLAAIGVRIGVTGRSYLCDHELICCTTYGVRPRYFHNAHRGETVWHHPLDPHFKQLVRLRRGTGANYQPGKTYHGRVDTTLLNGNPR